MRIEKYELTKKNIYNVYLSNGEVLELNGKVITDNELLIKKDIDNYKGYKGDIDNIDVGKSKLFGKKVELDTDDYQNLVKYAKKGIVADVEITKLKEENSKLKHDFNELKEKTRDFIRAIAYAPTKVMNFFKSLFKDAEQEKQRQLELA